MSRVSARAAAAWSLSSIESKLSIRKRAREDARSGAPTGEAQTLSEVERDILHALQADRAALVAERVRLAQEAEQTLRRQTPGAPDFQAAALDAVLAIKQEAARAGPDLRAAQGQARRTAADLATFRLQNGLQREAIYADAPILQAGFLLLAALAESLFSATLFAEDDARGLLGGAVTAIGLSGANVILGFLAGFIGLRYLQHKSIWLKTMGVSSFAGLGFLALILNMFAADWRDQLAAARTSPKSDASFHLWSLLNLDTPQAIILLMIGAGVWVFSAWKGYASFDDPYPDYGKLARAKERAHEYASEERSALLDEIETHLRALRQSVSDRLGAARKNVEASAMVFDGCAREITALDARCATLDALAEAAVTLYREENTAHRDSPAPGYFSAPPPAPDKLEDVLTGPAALMENARQSLAAIEAAGAAALKDVNETFTVLVKELTDAAA